MEEIPRVSFLNRDEQHLGFEISKFPKFGNDINEQNKNKDPRLPHRLNFFVILFVTGNKPGKHFIDFEEYDYKKGDIIFISKEQIHAFKDILNSRSYIFLFTEEFLIKNLLPSDINSLLQIYNYHIYHPVISTNKSNYLEFSQILNLIEGEYNKSFDSIKVEILRSLLKVFLLKAGRIRNELYNYEKSSYYNEFIFLQSLISQHLSKSRKVKYYASLMNISSKKLNMITQEFVKMPAKSYLDSIHILDIKRMLVNSSESIKEIGYKSGFNEPTNFIKYFKKLTKITPSECRRLNQ